MLSDGVSITRVAPVVVWQTNEPGTMKNKLKEKATRVAEGFVHVNLMKAVDYLSCSCIDCVFYSYSARSTIPLAIEDIENGGLVVTALSRHCTWSCWSARPLAALNSF